MNTYRVLFTKEKTEVTVKEGTTVLEAERIAGLCTMRRSRKMWKMYGKNKRSCGKSLSDKDNYRY